MKRVLIIRYIVVWIGCLFAISAMAQTQTITVGRGETFDLIAKRYGMTIEELKQMNPSAIDGVVGMKLKVNQKKAEEQVAVISTAEKKQSPSKAHTKEGKSSKKTKKGTPPKGSMAFFDKMMEMEIDALTYREKQNYSKAAKVYTDLIKMEPRADFYCERGRCYMLDKKYKAAIKDLEQGLRMGDLTEKELSDYNYLLTVSKDRRQKQIESRNATWAGIGAALAVGVAVAGTAYAASQSSSQPSYTSSAYTPSTYTSSNATSQFSSRSDQILANANAQMQQIGEATMRQAGQMKQRIAYVSQEQLKWSEEFQKKNGRAPNDYEVNQWLHDNYPDMWQLKIQSEANNASSSSSSTSKSSTQSSKSSTTKQSFDCKYCGGTGRVLYDDDGGVPHFGLEMKVSGKCSECGATTYVGYPHKHIDCKHCKKGKVTY